MNMEHGMADKKEWSEQSRKRRKRRRESQVRPDIII